MKGIIFSELVRWVEKAYGASIADKMIVQANLPNNGGFTSVGFYPHEQALALLDQLSGITDQPVADISQEYGHWLAFRLVELYPDMFRDYTDTFGFLQDIARIHNLEVDKLYPDAPTLHMTSQLEGVEFSVNYSSHRPFGDVAFGLLHGYIDFFDDDLVVVRDNSPRWPYEACFTIRPV